MQFYFAKKKVTGFNGSTKSLSALKVAARKRGGLMRIFDVSLERIDMNKPNEMLFQVGLSILRGDLQFFVAGSVVPSIRKPFGC